jgi:hypothetical protein
MAATVYSAVPQSSSRLHRATLLALHAFSGLLGGAVIGALLALIGRQLPVSSAVLVPILLGVALLESRRANLGIYQPQRGVPLDWMNWPRAAYMSAYGFVLGAGLFTPYGSSAVVALAALALLSHDVVLGATILGVYGLTRTLAEIVIGIAASSVGLACVTSHAQVAKAMLRRPMAALALLAAFSVAVLGRL